MSSVVRTSGALLLLGAAYAIAIAPEPLAAKVNATDRLEALVRDMVDNQHAPKSSAKATAEDLVIVDDGDRRRLAGCVCNAYRNGASSSSPVCSKKEGRSYICYPIPSSGLCNEEAEQCDASHTQAVPSPNPLLNDAEVFDGPDPEAKSFFQLNLQVLAESEANMPSPSKFAAAVATMTNMPAHSVSVLTSWKGGKDATHPPTATLQATIALDGPAERGEKLVDLMRGSVQLPPIDGVAYPLLHVCWHTGALLDQFDSTWTCLPPRTLAPRS